MKKIALISAIALSGLLYNNANAQIFQIGLHLGGGRPVVQASVIAPDVAVSYSNADDYFYLPEVDAYYSVAERNYYYNDGVRWVSAAYLPGEYRNYDWRNARHYEVRARRPYLNADVYREKYRGNARDWNRHDDRFDNRGYANRDDRRVDDRRSNEPVFERRNDNYRGAEHADNRGWDNGNRRDDNGGRGNYNQSQPNRGQDNNYQQGRGQSSYQQGQQQQAQPQQNQPSQQQGRGQGGYQQGGQQQQAQPQQNQPAQQQGRGQSGQQQRGHDANEQFASNRGQEHSRFKM